MQKSLLCLVLGSGCFSLGLNPLVSHAAEIEEYQRKYISFFATDQSSLDLILNQAMQSGLPRFAYQAIPMANIDLQGFAQTLYQYQQEHAGEIAAQKELPSLRFGDKVVSWEQTRRIIDSAFIMVPQWHFGELELKNLHEDRHVWYVDLASRLKLELQVYQLTQGQARLYTTLAAEWELADPLEVNDISSIVSSLSKATAGVLSPANPVVQPLILEALKAMPAYQQELAAKPEVRMLPVAQKHLDKNAFVSLFKTIKQQAAFGLKAHIEAINNETLFVTLPVSESALRLGVGLDHSYRLIEYQQVNGNEKAVPIGFARVRKVQEQNLELQPIQVLREPEMGDQLLEYPQLGIQLEFLGGTTALGFENEPPNNWVAQGGMRLSYNAAKVTGISELYAHYTGTLGMPLSTSSLTPERLNQVSKEAFALPIFTEFGLLKRWYWRQFIFELGAQGGLLSGFLFNAKVNNDIPYTLSLGGTLLAGLAYQLTPDALIGLQGGWRVYLPSKWTTSSDKGPTNVDLPGLSINGPVAQLYFSWMF
ncbi:MAG: hypothetical protein IV090_23810 [Candidatus Sericytochromatia bacterium]|nr:hypothetical protein [Candidatus Sericytochromatia bacterium]